MVKKCKLILFLLLATGFTLSAQKRSCDEVLSAANALVNEGQYTSVRKVLNQTKATCSSEEQWFYVQFNYQAGMNNLDSVHIYMTKAKKMFPTRDSVLYLYAQSCLMQYDSAMAVKGLDAIGDAIRTNKNKTAYQLCRVQLLDAANQPEKALEAIKQVKDADRYYDVQVQWGVLLQKLNKPKDALAKYNRAVKIDKYGIWAYMQKADLYFNVLGKQDEALAVLDTVEMLDSTLADPMLMRAEFFERHGDYDNAIAEYDEALQTDSSVHEVYIFRGTCLKEIREYELAEEDYITYKKKNPHDKEINYLVAELYIDKGDYAAAASLLSQMETSGSGDYEMYLLRGVAYNDNGQYDDAMKDFNKAEGFSERDVRLFQNRGICYLNKKDYRKAKYDFERAINMEADNMELHYLRCQAAYEAGFYEEACQSCKVAEFHGLEGMDKKYMKGCK